MKLKQYKIKESKTKNRFILLRVLVAIIAIISIGGLTTAFIQARELRTKSEAITATADSLKKIGTALLDIQMSNYDKFSPAERKRLDEVMIRFFHQADSLYTLSAIKVLEK